MAHLDSDIVYEIVCAIASFRPKDSRITLRNLACASRGFNYASRSLLFAKIKWPHPNQHDENSGLHLPPETIWPHIKTLHLDWPDHWLDASPPLWGSGAVHRGTLLSYKPMHLDKLEAGLPKMNNIHTFMITCPFDPPTSLLTALVGCPNIKDFRIIDTPLYTALMPSLPPEFKLERISLVAVAEASRVGEGPFDLKHHERPYFSREYRRKFWNDTHSRFAASRYVFQIGRPDSLTYLQMSGSHCIMYELRMYEWPNLEALVLTGNAPGKEDGFARLVDIIPHMPRLYDLRLLFAPRDLYEVFDMFPPPHGRIPVEDQHPNTVFAQIKYLAVSNGCNLKDAFRNATSLERLVVCAISKHPRIATAFSVTEIKEILDDLALGGGNMKLKRLRIMLEENIIPGLFDLIGKLCPLLEFLEVEKCGYTKGDPDFEWSEFGDALAACKHLQTLRIAMMVGVNDAHPGNSLDECDIDERKRCACYLASRIPSLSQIGLEYRTRTGSHRSEDRWIDFFIERLDDETIYLHELEPSWYPFPEVWDVVPLDY
ncbi:hypothetical protein B0H34DRAFT_772553 [Crassisporium funariophilum]|nr:hypothetical protein B0H34DRAFT_772553 [Crassisporium funariophilum]